MKITINNIINFMKEKQNFIIEDEQIEEIKKHFYKEVEDLIYWSFTENNRYYDIKLDGTITKEFYDKLQSDRYKDKEYSFGEVVDNMGDVEFKIKELKFNDDPEIILAYQNTDRFYERGLGDIIDDD